MNAHARLSASGSSTWLNCPGSAQLTDGMEEQSSKYAQEGTRAHTVAEQILTGKIYAASQEMIDYVTEYVDYIRQHPGHRSIEQRVDFSNIAPNAFGTADALISHEDHLSVIDLKYGKGIKVFAEGNSQLMLYALGALNTFALGHINTIKLAVVQPRLDHIDEDEISRADLIEWGKWAKLRADLCDQPNAELIPGEAQCRWCKASPTCPAKLKVLHDAVGKDFMDETDPDLPHTDLLTNAELAKILDKRKLIEGWFKEIDAWLTTELTQGRVVPNYKLVSGSANRKWGDEEKAESALFPLLGAKAFAPPKIISPAQAEKALGKADKNTIQDLIVKPTGAPTLVKASDKRPAINVSLDDFD